MPIVWDDTEILGVIDESRRANTGVATTGWSLMEEIVRRHGYQLDHGIDYRTFVRELLLARAAGLITYSEVLWGGYGPDPGDPNAYLQRVQELDVTMAGRDRAEG